ncbi:MAG: mannose-1-phosphate guanylyltransferase/mannose-6-phosphate isomerase [Pseudomonadota bacterium]
MTQPRVAPFVLSGGAGTRLWPVSRAGMAKQLVPVLDAETLLQKTVARFADRGRFEPVTLIGAHADRFVLREQMQAIGADAHIVVEPERRDTLAAVVLAAAIAARRDPETVVAVVPSDHLIEGADAFADALTRACAAVQTGGIAVVGVEPTEPSTAYGYIRPGPAAGAGVHRVAHFVEKPDAPTAARLISEEGCLWNAGIFCFASGWLLDAARALEPETVAAVTRSVAEARTDLGFSIPGASFAQARAISFDHGFMEHTDQALVVPSTFNWSDVGDWKSVWAVSDKSTDGIAARGDTVDIGSRNTLVHATHRMVCTVGLENVAVIETPDAVLVLNLDRAQDVKALVKTLEADSRGEALEHLRCHRPWGWYQTMDLGARFRVKRISVKPGARLSLQRHHHRAEHWVVVHGTAEVTLGEEVRVLHENESAFIPIGSVHRLANPGKIPVELIEVQSGSYLEEDDIERLEDQFGRVEDLTSHRQNRPG